MHTEEKAQYFLKLSLSSLNPKRNTAQFLTVNWNFFYRKPEPFEAGRTLWQDEASKFGGLSYRVRGGRTSRAEKRGNGKWL